MNITKEQADKVIAALEIAKATLIEYGDWWPVGEPIAIVDCAEALSIMRGLADAEPVGEVLHRMKYHSEDPSDDLDWELFPMDCTECETCIDVLIVRASPQAAQTEAALCEMVRLSEDAGLYDSDFQTGRAGSKP
jgi:hypothetical protein